MIPRLFTREEAEALLPEIIPLLRDLQRKWAELVDATTAEVVLRQRMAGNGHALLGELEALMQRVAAARMAAAEVISRVGAFGCELKDPVIGLLDFPAERFGRVVYLCWQLGEPRIAWWHDIDSGYAGRQPLDP